MFKGPFIWKKQDLQAVIQDEIRELQDFISIQGLEQPEDIGGMTPSLMPTPTPEAE